MPATRFKRQQVLKPARGYHDVVVQYPDDVACAGTYTLIPGFRTTEVLLVCDHLSDECTQVFVRSIGGSIIDKDQLVGDVRPSFNGLYTLSRVLDLIVDRNDETDAARTVDYVTVHTTSPVQLL